MTSVTATVTTPAGAPTAGDAATVVPRAFTVGDVAGRVTAILTAAGVSGPRVDARWLVSHALGIDPWQRPAAVVDEELDEGLGVLEGLVARRAAREPLQLVLGETAFRTLTLTCRPGVFVPRPETEVVAGLAIEAARAAGPRAVVAEPCTGTGAIACSLAAELAGVRVVAGDLDPLAVATARANVRRLAEGRAGVAGPAAGATVEVRTGDLLEALPRELLGRLDVLVANPPYLPAADRDAWAPEVASHDPDRALVGGPDGHEVVTVLVAAASAWLRPGGTLVIEIDARRGPATLGLAHEAGLVEARIEDDLTGRPRALVARAPGAAPVAPTDPAPRVKDVG